MCILYLTLNITFEWYIIYLFIYLIIILPGGLLQKYNKVVIN